MVFEKLEYLFLMFWQMALHFNRFHIVFLLHRKLSMMMAYHPIVQHAWLKYLHVLVVLEIVILVETTQQGLVLKMEIIFSTPIMVLWET